MQVSRWRIGGVLVLGFLVATCAGVPANQATTATGSSLAPSTPPASALAEAGPSASPAGSVTPVTTPGAPTATPLERLPAATTPSASSRPAPSASSEYPNGEAPVTSWKHGLGGVQAQLLADLRDDAKVGCAATPALPVGAVAGAECHPNNALVALVDVVGFGSPDAALGAYRARLAVAGIGLRTGDCSAGQPGEAAWAPGDGQWGPGGVEPDREGCFIDASGHANVLALCGDGASIAIVGKTADLAALTAWADRFPAAATSAGRVSTPSPPGICYGGWGP